jgi:hypothetical protein
MHILPFYRSYYVYPVQAVDFLLFPANRLDLSEGVKLSGKVVFGFHLVIFHIKPLPFTPPQPHLLLQHPGQ